MSQIGKTKSVAHGAASRLPDTSWLWRRVLIFSVCAVCLVIAWRVSEKVVDTTTLRQINRYTYGLLALSLLLYGVGATVTDVTKLITAFLSTKKTVETLIPHEVDSPAAPPAIDDGELPASQRVMP